MEYAIDRSASRNCGRGQVTSAQRRQSLAWAGLVTCQGLSKRVGRRSNFAQMVLHQAEAEMVPSDVVFVGKVGKRSQTKQFADT